jgi:HAD superfamily hydrolase (TIGR01509 family)
MGVEMNRVPVQAAIRGVIFDVDGTLVQSNDAHAHAWEESLKGEGCPITFEMLRVLIGMGGDQILRRLTDIDPDSAQAREVSIRRAGIFIKDYLPDLKPTSGAHDLVQRLHDDGFGLVVASSAQPGELNPLLDVAGVRKLLQNQAPSDQVQESKPNPDIVRAALDRLQMDPAAVVMIGDTPYDVEAAQRAGVRIVGVRCGGWNDDALQGAIAVYDSPADLLAHYKESVFKRGPTA